MIICVNNKPQLTVDSHLSCADLKQHITKELGLNPVDYYLIVNGKYGEAQDIAKGSVVHIILRVFGGKGGFGSMLRAIGAQIEKTTNREACRDLSGRRLRDINEEQRLKNWISQQAEREKEAKERKKKKLERLCEKPKHEFKDEEYYKERSALPEKVEDAVLQGLQASCSSKRKAVDQQEVIKKKPKLWMDDELDADLSSSDENENSDIEEDKKNSSDMSKDVHFEDSKSVDEPYMKNNVEDTPKLDTEKSLENSAGNVDEKINFLNVPEEKQIKE